MGAFLSLYIRGFLMGMSELIPGISSGTIAFILGLYTKLFASIKTFDSAALKYLLKCDFKHLKEHVAWKFLGTLIFGAGTAILLFTRFIHWCLSTPIARSNLYALFLGLVLASFIYCLRQIRVWKGYYVLYLVVGAFLTAWLVTQEVSFVAPEQGDAFPLGASWLLKVFVAGIVAVSAMLLPGISGSYLLHMFGLYGWLITALKWFSEGNFHTAPVLFLVAMGLGVCVGAVLFSRFVSYLLKEYHGATISFFSGIMLGATPTLWPFWTWKKVGGSLSLLQPVQAYFPELNSSLLYSCSFFFIIGIVALAVLEKWAEKNPVKMQVCELDR